ncbi:MAG TPA: YlzJ-like family protein [Firmicutes bacterium]|nr:YlzJ-like family protein [Bacillota bacterium]
MPLHTILDLNEVLFDPYHPQPDEFQYYNSQGRIFKGVWEPGGFRVSALFSTDPCDYLNPSYQAGALLRDQRPDSL